MVVDQRVKSKLHSIGPVVRRELGGRHIRAAIADLDGWSIVLEIVAVDFMIVAVESQPAARADEKVAVHLTAISVSQGQFGAAFAEGIEAINIGARFVAHRSFIFAAGPYEKVVFDYAMRRRQASRAVTDVQG
jgi:hypothetical protein